MDTIKEYKKGMVFGVFDIFHPGHEYFLTRASKMCESLTVVIARSEVVELLKKRTPKNSLEERARIVKNYNNGFNVVYGDSAMGSWQVLKDNQFDIIFLGYDQQGISLELDKLGVKYEILDSHFPEIYKSSLLIK